MNCDRVLALFIFEHDELGMGISTSRASIFGAALTLVKVWM